MQPDMLFHLLITQRRRLDRLGRQTARITELKQEPEGEFLFDCIRNTIVTLARRPFPMGTSLYDFRVLYA
jgi:hypothetical protein